MNSCRLASWSALSLTVALIIPKAPARGAELSKFLPDDTQIVVYVNVQQILDSDLVKKYALPQTEGAFRWNTKLLEMVTALGLDPLKDIASVTIAAPGDVSEKKWLVLIRGHFEPAKIQAAAEELAKRSPEALTIHQESNLRIYEARAGERATPILAAVLDKENLVVSPVKDYVVEAAAKNSGKKPGALDKNLKEFVDQVDGKQSLWLAALVPEQLKAAFARDKQTKGIVDHLTALSGGVKLTDGAQAGIRIFLNDPKAARDLRQMLVGIQAVAILAVNGNDRLKDYGPLLSDILSSIKFSVDKNLVGIDLNVTPQQIETGIKK
jgi:hypothetical protein